MWYTATCCQNIQINISISETLSIRSMITLSTNTSVCGTAKFSHPQSTHLSCSHTHLCDGCTLPDNYTWRMRRKKPPTKLCHCQRRLDGNDGAAWMVWVYELFLNEDGVRHHSGILSLTGCHSIHTIKWPDYCSWSALFVECCGSVRVHVCFNFSVKCECGPCRLSTISYDICGSQYHNVDASVINIAISPNWYEC